MNGTYEFLVESENSIREELVKKYNISRREYRRIKSSGEVYINGSLQKVTYPVKEGDKVLIIIKEVTEIIPQEMNLNIVYEDDYLILLDKPGDTLVHPVHSERTDTLANGLLGYRDKKGEGWGIHPVHRLDRETSGLVLFAKTSHIHNIMGQELLHRKVKREYLAFVDGVVKDNQGVIDFPILDIPVKKRVDPNGKAAITLFQTVKRYRFNTLLRLNLLTGRTHQIRIHLKALGFGVVGDTLYHQKSDLISRQALHAFRLTFTHPVTQQEMSFISKVPEDFQDLLENIYT